MRPSDARRQKLQPAGAVPVNLETPGGGVSRNAIAIGRRDDCLAPALRDSGLGRATAALARQLRGKEIYLRVFAADALAAIGPGAKAALPELKALQKRGYKDIAKSPEMEA